MLLMKISNYYIKVMATSQDPVKLIVTFPQNTKLDSFIDQISSSYVFVQFIKKLSQNQLVISFDCMSDLLEIDFISQFGAISTQVRNSQSFSQEMKMEYSLVDSTEQIQSISDSINKLFSMPGDYFEAENFINPPEPLTKEKRLTSLEDEVIQQEKLRKQFDLFDDMFNESYQNIGKSELKLLKQGQNGTLDQSQKQIPHQNQQKQSFWVPLMGGMVLTSLVVGGFKAIKLFF